MIQKLTVFSKALTPEEFDRPRPDRLEKGNPLRTTRNHFEKNGVSAGLWTCETGAWRIAFAPGKDEFFHVIEGRIQITNAAGQAEQFGPGDAGVIPAEFTGVFEVLEPVRKHYVIVDRAAVQ
ncbi:Cupin [Limnobacter sp. 130]|uniref:cupin domain-containing protein n=1 Tax=Limnobacter sp. 130 TaxID=2653147 RepID=UPI0012EFEA7E|nr:cupin domain-containing protein [Limnobacter sp. 130]VWX34841.1 Cupin [Limnobacter sp. 130]